MSTPTRFISPVKPPPVQQAPVATTNWQLENDIARRCSFYAVLALVFLKFSSIHEIFQALTGRSLHVMYIVVPCAALGMLLSGGVQRTLTRMPAWFWLGFTLWAAVGIPFSSWVAGSVGALFLYCRTELLMLFLLAGTVVTWKECRTVLNCAAVAVVVPVLFSLLYGSSGDRLAFDFQGTIANPNDLAAHILYLLPFLLFVIFRPGTAFAFRLIGAGFAVLATYAVLRTGSRGGLLAIGVAGLMFLFRATARQRIIAALMVPLAIAGGLFLVPPETMQRLLSFSEDEGSRMEALESSESRIYLLKKSIEFTFQNPVFGIGMSQFSNFEGRTSVASGQRGNWHATHNAYTQVSSELGIPALLFYLAAIAGTMIMLSRTTRRARSAGHSEIAMAASYLIVSLIGFCTAIIFLSLAYMFYLPALTGLAIALERVAEPELNLLASRNLRR